MINAIILIVYYAWNWGQISLNKSSQGGLYELSIMYDALSL